MKCEDVEVREGIDMRLFLLCVLGVSFFATKANCFFISKPIHIQRISAARTSHASPFVLRAWPWEEQEAKEESTAIPEDNGTGGKKPGITFQGLVDLVALGAGAPNLGKFKGVDKETGALQFELEKNNFKSSKTGKTYNSFDNRDATYFEEGYIDEDADVMAKIGKFFGGNKKE